MNLTVAQPMEKVYAEAQWRDDGATLDDLREAVTKLVEIERTARRVLGGAHPFVKRTIANSLQNARALAARDVEALRDAVGAMGV